MTYLSWNFWGIGSDHLSRRFTRPVLIELHKDAAGACAGDIRQMRDISERDRLVKPVGRSPCEMGAPGNVHDSNGINRHAPGSQFDGQSGVGMRVLAADLDIWTEVHMFHAHNISRIKAGTSLAPP